LKSGCKDMILMLLRKLLVSISINDEAALISFLYLILFTSYGAAFRSSWYLNLSINDEAKLGYVI